MGWLSKIFSGGSSEKKAAEAAAKKASGEQAANSGGEDGEEGQEHGVAGKGYVETKQGKFGRKKVIETNLGPDGKPVYTGYQLEQAMQRMKSRKKAREQAKKEEKAYVEYRKAEILRQFQPKVGTLRLGDEAYPKRRRVGMGFGERKAHYLAIRPKPKYATWIGRKKGIIEAKAQPKPNAASTTVITDHSMLPDHSVRAHTKHDDKEEQSVKGNEATKEKTEIEKPAGAGAEGGGGAEAGKEKKVEATTAKKDEKKEKAPKPPKKEDKKYPVVENSRFSNPLKTDGQPFWCGDTEEVNDEDLPVDMDILEKVCSGEKVLCQRPFNKIEFSPFGPIAAMKADDVLFVRDTMLFANTVESVISLQPEDDKKKKLPPATPYKLKWSETVRVKMFHPALRVPHILDKSWTEQFHMVTRDKDKKVG